MMTAKTTTIIANCTDFCFSISSLICSTSVRRCSADSGSRPGLQVTTSHISCVAIQSTERTQVLEQSSRLTHLLVCQSVWWVNCGKTSDWIWMPFGVVSGVGQGMGVLDGVEIIKITGQFWGKNWTSNCGVVILCHEGW